MTKPKTPQKKESAAEAYKTRAMEIDVQMEALADALEEHRRNHEARPASWGLVGDLAHIREILAEAIGFLNLGEA